jgi:hypothetical protein
MEYFTEILNGTPPAEIPDITPAEELLHVNLEPLTKLDVNKAIKQMKNGKSSGPDGIPPEALKIDTNVSTEMIYPLLKKIWEQEEIPTDWITGNLVKLPKKGDFTMCNNWRRIMLLSIPSNVLTRIILERLKTALDKRLRPEQAGVCQDKSCTDYIATLQIIIEQTMEWQCTLYITFVDFKRVFDSVDREVMWKLMQHHGIPQNRYKRD